MPARRKPSLTIGDVAAFAGVTVRAVRHYHQRGLLPEPPRDASGYRRYDAEAVVDLIRIKALSEAGVPLARVRELLEAEPDEFAASLADIDDTLRDEIRRLEAHRDAVARLASADALALPTEVVDYLTRLRGHGISERTIASERDAWLLISAHARERVGEWVTSKAAMLDEPAFVDLYRTFDQAHSWAPGDPRFARLADDLIIWSQQHEPSIADIDGAIDDNLVALLDAKTLEESPGLRHLAALLEQRGMSR